ncbi:hypothetical protein GQX74_005825 [Glossina fuscipes]|nr:hypothetical protein GQX74_005825 [Glossina fuscipes]
MRQSLSDSDLESVSNGIFEGRLSLVIGDRVKDENPWADGENVKEMYKGAIHEVLRHRILIRFDGNFQREYDYRDYRLEFCLSRYDYRKQHYAISRAAEKLGEQFLLPSQVQTRERSQLDVRLNGEESLLLDNRQYEWYNSKVKFIQKKAVANILRGKIRNMPYVIFGPPGTGKTAKIVEMIIQIFKLIPTAHMLVGTPSNNSADVITAQLIGVLRMYELIRLVSHKELKKGLIPEHLMPYCATGNKYWDTGLNYNWEDEMSTAKSGLKMKSQMEYLGRHRVTIGTCATLGNFLHMRFPPNHFTHVLIDEAFTEKFFYGILNACYRNTSTVLWYDNGTQNPPAVNLSDHIVAFGCDQRMVLRMFQR